jgi:hypothetical protein
MSQKRKPPDSVSHFLNRFVKNLILDRVVPCLFD